MATAAVLNNGVVNMGLVANPSGNERQPWECPLTLERYVDPVTDECGCTFERADLINMVFKDKVEAQCPATRAVIHRDKLVPNRAMRDLCEARAKQDALAGKPALAIPIHPNGGPGAAAGIAQHLDARFDELLELIRAERQEAVALRYEVRCLRGELRHAVKKFDIQSIRMNNMLAMTICDMASTVLPQWLGGVDLTTIANRNLSEKEIALVTKPEPAVVGATLDLIASKQHDMDYKGAR